LLLYPLGFVLFLAPGLALACWLVRRCSWPAWWTALLAVVPAAAAGEVVFWACFLDPTAGRAASAVVLLLSGACLLALVRRGPLRQTACQADVAGPVVLMFLLGIAYFGILGLLFVAAGRGLETTLGDLWPNLYLAADNFIPWLFAEHLYAGTDPRQLLADWHSSDRPPLQTGLVLVQLPLADWAGLGVVQYQILGTIFQSTWVLAVWSLGRQLGLGGRRLAAVLLFCATSPFFVFHSLYVWPKLLAGTLAVVAVLLLVGPGGRPAWPNILIAALAGALALQAHAGAAFTLLGLALFLLAPSRFPGFAKLLAAMAVAAVVLAPWTAYQRGYDPPGNRLLKWHLAGVVAIDDRPFAQAFREAYSRLSLAELARHKWANVQALVGVPWIEPTYRGEGWRAVWKNGEYYNLLKALGVLNIGWLVLAISGLRPGGNRRTMPHAPSPTPLLGVALAGLAVWLLLMFGPGTTMIYQGPFATVILLFVVLAAALTTLPPPLVTTLLVVHVLDLIVIWLIR
jgi:hypothetical protein